MHLTSYYCIGKFFLQYSCMSEKNHISEDYISLSGFGKGVRDVLHAFFWFLSFLNIVLIKSRYYILAGLLGGLILGYLYYKTRPTYYKASMVVEFNELTKKTYAEMIEQLNKLTGPGSGERLGQALNIPVEAAARVALIEPKDMNDNPLKLDTSTRKWQPFKISLRLTDNSVADTLQDAIVNYLNSRPLLKKIKYEQRKISFEKLAFINSDLQKLDSLKIEYNRFLSRPNVATFYNNAFNPAELYVQSSNLTKEKETLMRWLAIDSAAVSVIDGFKVSASPQSIGLFKSLLIFGAIGLLIGYLIGFMKETKKKVSGSLTN